MMLKVRDALKKDGYEVWMDVDQLGGSTLQAMAQGIENAAAILIGVSREYKLSANCRSGNYDSSIISIIYIKYIYNHFI